jgi:hypothetical protein
MALKTISYRANEEEQAQLQRLEEMMKKEYLSKNIPTRITQSDILRMAVNYFEKEKKREHAKARYH